MKRQPIHLQDLMGREVIDADGESAGRIEEVLARRHGSDYLVEEFHLGRQALFERLSIADLSLGLLHFVGARQFPASKMAKWKQMDLSDPLHPKLRCRVDELHDLKRG